MNDETRESAIGHYRWVICALLFLATTVNYIDRQILALIKPILYNELHWTNEQFGRANAVFLASYAISGLLFGKFIDRFGTKIGYATSIAAWSLRSSPLRSRYQEVPQMRCRFQPRSRSTFSRSRSRSRAALAEWYW